MGIFSGKKIISVASAVYNMAGDEKDRPIYLQNLILRNILSGTKKGLGETIPVGYLQGPGIKYRNFFKWAARNYDLVGMPTGAMQVGDLVNMASVEPGIPRSSGDRIWVQEAFLGSGDYDKWADQWMLRNRPDDFSTTNWEASFNGDTNQVTITFEGSTSYTFLIPDFNAKAKYIYAYYTKSRAGDTDPVVTGTLVSLAPGASFPSVTGYTLVSDNTVSRSQTLTTTTTIVRTFSDGRPNTSSSSSTNDSATINRRTRIYERVVNLGNSGDEDAKLQRRDIRRLINDKKVTTNNSSSSYDETISGGVIRTTTTYVAEQVLTDDNSHRTDTQKIYEVKWYPLDLFIYKIGSGTTVLDNLVNTVADYGQFYPMIPIRLKNKFLDEVPAYAPLEALVKRAYHRATDGGRISKLLDDLSDNKDLKDMDYIYVVFGVSLNTIDNSARKYIYEFFSRLKDDQIGGDFTGFSYADQLEAYNEAYIRWDAWRRNDNAPPGSEPILPPKPILPNNEIRIASRDTSDDFDINFDIGISWHYIAEGFGNGIAKAGAKKNDVWLEVRETVTLPSDIYTGEHNRIVKNTTTSYDVMRIWFQHTENSYKYLDVAGLVHRNYVYGTESVIISAKQALDDGDESGFIVPLHYATQRAMRLVDSTQMGTACMFLMINVYEIHKRKWWQSGFFSILFVIVVAIVSVVFTGGAGFGLLGSHLAVGGSFGLTGMTAAIVGSVANALAAMILTTVLSKLTEKMGILGSVLSAIIGIMVSGLMTSMQNGTAFSFNFNDLMRADNLLKLTSSVGDGYAAYVKGSITDMQNELTQIQEDANSELKRIRESYLAQFGYGGGQIDPMMFVGDSPVIAESRDTFLSRTLMSGTDVVEMSQDMLNNYVELNLTLENAFT